VLVRQAFRDAVARLQNSAGGQQVLARISAHELDAMTARLGSTAVNGAHDALLTISPGLAASFVGEMEKAAARAAAGVGEHITGIDRRTRQAVRDVIAKALRDGNSIPDISRKIQNVVGLTDGQGLALDQFEKTLVKQAVDPARVRIQVAAFRDRLLASRGEMIARYETMWASNAGRLDGYAFAAAQGAIGTDATVAWLAADGCCDECADMDGETITLGDTFSDGSDGPPGHPNCRCTTVLASEGTIPGGDQ